MVGKLVVDLGLTDRQVDVHLLAEVPAQLVTMFPELVQRPEYFAFSHKTKTKTEPVGLR